MLLSTMLVLVITYLILYARNPGCPVYTPKPELDLDRYFGKWYEMYRPVDASFETGECVVFECSEDDFEPNLYFKIRNSEQVNGTRR
jgi:lipocalin